MSRPVVGQALGALQSSIDRRLTDRLAEARLQEIEVAAFVDVVREHPAIAALVAEFGLAPGSAAALGCTRRDHRVAAAASVW
jgi:hypothetical protein